MGLSNDGDVGRNELAAFLMTGRAENITIFRVSLKRRRRNVHEKRRTLRYVQACQSEIKPKLYNKSNISNRKTPRQGG